jgi:hypothetical protein
MEQPTLLHVSYPGILLIKRAIKVFSGSLVQTCVLSFLPLHLL